MQRRIPILLLPLSLALSLGVLGACSYEDATDEKSAETPAPAAQQQSQTEDDFAVPIGAAEYDSAALDQGRLDPAWREYAERDRLERMGQTAPAPAPGTASEPSLTTGMESSPPSGAEGRTPVTPPGASRPASTETFEQIAPAALRGAPKLPVARDGAGPSALKVQILLDRARFSPGVIDGHWGKNTEKAVYWFQFAQGLNPTGEVDQGTWDALTRAAGPGELVTQVSATPEDLKGPFVPVPDDPYEQEKLECLCYASALELYAERGHTTPELIQKLNPQVDFASLAPGTALVLPAVPQMAADQVESRSGARATPAANREGSAQSTVAQAQAQAPGQAQGRQPAPGQKGQIAKLLISKRGFYLQALDAQGHILYHFPTTLGSKYDPSATGTLKVTGIHPEPTFHYQPKLFADVSDDKPEANLPAGPNSPVGLVWMSLSKRHHGIHGTAVPDTIGYTSSHGCVRLTNWDALFLAQHIQPGTEVLFRE